MSLMFVTILSGGSAPFLVHKATMLGPWVPLLLFDVSGRRGVFSMGGCPLYVEVRAYFKLAAVTLVICAMPVVNGEASPGISFGSLHISTAFCCRWRTLHTYFYHAVCVLHFSDDLSMMNMDLPCGWATGCRY